MAKRSSKSKSKKATEPERLAPPNKNPLAVFETDYGTFMAEIFLEEMPVTAGNFISLAKRGFFDGLLFHRVVPDFMVQTGCPHSRNPASKLIGTGEPLDGRIDDEFKDAYKISNLRGTLAMANKGVPDSGASQFFINLVDNLELDWWRRGEERHPVFGYVVQGLEVCDSISQVSANAIGKPMDPLRLDSVVIVE